MVKVSITEPIWSTKSLGINVPHDYIGPVEIECTYVNKRQERVFPESWILHTSVIRTFSTQRLKNNTLVHIVPIINLIKNSIK